MTKTELNWPLTRREWCAYRRCSNSYYWRLKADGKAPRSYKMGNQDRITEEADAEWIAAREAASMGTAA